VKGDFFGDEKVNKLKVCTQRKLKQHQINPNCDKAIHSKLGKLGRSSIINTV
jgi:hypothetical protein